MTIEGPDGGGKTTQAALLAEHLATRLPRVHLTREPGGTWLGERVREVIRPSLDDGITVVCARYADSSLAYQGYGSGVPLDTLRSLADISTGGLQPDLTIVLDLPVEVGLGRKEPGDVTRFEAEFDLAYHVRVRDGFLQIAAAEPDRVVVVDATADVASVASAVGRVVDERLGSGGPEPSGRREP